MRRHRILLPGILVLGFLSTPILRCQPAVEIVGGKELDLGTLLTSRTISREVTLRNTGTDTLKIWAVSGTCGCTGTLLSNDHLLPGKEGVLKITLNPSKLSGQVTKTVSMKTNDPADPNPHISLHADIRRILDLNREYLVFYTHPDSAATLDLKIKNSSDGEIRIVEVKSDTPDLTTELSENSIPPSGEATLTCRLLPSRAGIMKGNLMIRTDNPLIPELSIRYFSYAKREGSGIPAKEGK